MKDKLKNAIQWCIHILFFFFMGIMTVILLVIHAAASIFEIPQKLFSKKEDPETLKERERAEYYNRYI